MIGIFILLTISMLLVIKYCKKRLKLFLSIIIIIIAIYCAILSIDINRTNSMQKPIFAKLVDTGYLKEEFKGLGYKIEIQKDKKEEKIISSTMYFFDKVIAGAIE